MKPPHPNKRSKAAGQSAFETFLNYIALLPLVLFGATVLANVGALVMGRDDLSASLFGPLMAVFIGLFLVSVAVVNAIAGKKAYVAGAGWITRKERPLPYLAMLCIPLLFGGGVMALGIWFLMTGPQQKGPTKPHSEKRHSAFPPWCWPVFRRGPNPCRAD